MIVADIFYYVYRLSGRERWQYSPNFNDLHDMIKMLHHEEFSDGGQYFMIADTGDHHIIIGGNRYD